jgi:hypothetical protein
MDQNVSTNAQNQAENTTAAVSPLAVSRSDVDFIRKSLITLGVCVLFSGTLIGVSKMILNRLQQTGMQLQAQRDDARSRFTQAATEKEEIKDYQPRFLQLRARGFFGPEKRLDLIEHIRRVHDARMLLPLNYEISPQQIIQLDPTILNQDLELRSSKIVLQMNLLHEMDLFDFLADLKSKAFYTAQGCTVKRAESVALAALTPRLNAECTLILLSVGEHMPDGAPNSDSK